jgi:superfamily II DNA or RNA helicase
MVLAHNKSILKYMYEAIVHREIASVGYYIGGMKEAALKLTESKKIVIATYSMASEALDIKTLTTLIMATPKTNIEQSVGRILRSKHSNPIVVDIIDRHGIFSNQWNKRKKFYNSQKYKIVYSSNMDKNENINITCDDNDNIVEPIEININENIDSDMFAMFQKGLQFQEEEYEEI